MYSPDNSILNRNQFSLQMARKRLDKYNYNINNYRNKSSSIYRTPLITNSQYFQTSPSITTNKPIKPKSKYRMSYNKVNTIIQNNRVINNLNIDLINNINVQNEKIDDTLIEKIKELNNNARTLQKELRKSNDNNFDILSKYEKLKSKLKQVNEENKFLEEEIRRQNEISLNIKNSNLEIDNNINTTKQNYKKQIKDLKESYNSCRTDYNIIIEKFDSLLSMNKSLQKTKNDFRDVIYKMKDTINVLEKRKKSESYDMDIIERKIREKSLQVEIRDNQLNNLINNYNNLKQEGIVIDKNLQNTMIEAANLEDAFQRFEFIKSTLKNYDNKIIQLLNFIRERDKEIENINIQCNIIFQKIEKKRNEIDKNKNNYIDDKYKITTIPEEINIETLDEDNINFNNDNINENNDKKQNINNINNKDEEILLNDNNNDINKEIKDNDNKENNDNLSYQENEKKGEMKKNYSQTLLDENKKLQEEYKQLIKENINPIIEGKFSEDTNQNQETKVEESEKNSNSSLNLLPQIPK
jgi:hypothetical protein